MSSSSTPALPGPSPPFGFHGLGSTASLVGILKAAALNPYETSDPDDGLTEDLSLWSPPVLSPEPESQPLPESDSSDDGSLTTNEDFLLLTSNRLVLPQASVTGPSALDYPSIFRLDGLARQIIGQPTRRPEAGAEDVDQPASPSPKLPLPHCRSLAELASEPEEPLSTLVGDLAASDRLSRLVEQFGPWTGLDANGSPESETWIDQVPGVLYRSVIVKGVIALTNRRLCYLAYLPVVDNGKSIRSGTATFKSDCRFSKRHRRWIELRVDSLTSYRSSTQLFRPHSSLRLSDVKRILPINPAAPRTVSLRLADAQLVPLEFDTTETANLWYHDFVNALFSLKTNYSNQIKLSIPLRRIRKLYRENFDGIAKMMTFDLDFGSLESMCFQDGLVAAVRDGVIERSPTNHQSEPNQNRLKLAYLLNCDPFDEAVIDATARAKMEIIDVQTLPSSSSQSSSKAAHATPPPLLEVLEPEYPLDTAADQDGEEKDLQVDNNDQLFHSSGELAKAFVKAFGLKADHKLYICSCSLVRTLPAFGNMAISGDYFCFWRRVVMIGQDFKLRIPLTDIGLVRESSAFGFTRYGLSFEIAGEPDIRLDFSTSTLRDETIKALTSAVETCRTRLSRRQSSLPVKTIHPLGEMPENLQTPPCLSKENLKRLPALIYNGELSQNVKPLRIVCMTIGSRGDVQPYISLAKRLMQDGHIVTIASHPEYRTWVESFGILYKDVGGDPGALMKLSVEHPFFSAGFFKESLGHFRKWLDDLFNEAWLACKESQTELLIESPSTFSGIHIAEALKIPYFRAFTMTWTSTSTYPQAFAASMDLGPTYNLLSYSLFDSLIWRAMSGQVNRWRKHTLGIPPTTMEKMQHYKVPFLYNFSSAVVPKPIDWRDHVSVTGYWFLDQSHGDYLPPSSLTNFIASARADNVSLIYVGFGSVTVPDASAVTRAIYGAVVGAGVRAIVAKGWSERATVEVETVAVPAEVYVLESVPHDWLFPQIDAVCHHGGAGTTGISLRFGLPTLIHPFFGDQMFWADRVTRLGAGMRVESLSMGCLMEAFEKATQDRVMKEKAAQIGERIRQEDGPKKAVEFIYRHLDFALERTEHRILRTAPKRPKTTEIKSPNAMSFEEAALEKKKRGTDLPIPNSLAVVTEGGSKLTKKKKESLISLSTGDGSGGTFNHNRKILPHAPSLSRLKELVLSLRFLVRMSSSSTSLSSSTAGPSTASTVDQGT